MADRANLYYKIGSLVDIPFFNVEESVLIKRMGETETFEDVLEVARDLYEYCKQPEKEQEKVATKQNTESNAGGGEEPDDKPVDETLDESKPQQSPVDSSPSDNDENIDEDLPSDLGGETDGEEPEVRTADNLEDSIRDLIQSMDQQENMYLEIPELNMKTTSLQTTRKFTITLITGGKLPNDVSKTILTNKSLVRLIMSFVSSNGMHRKKSTTW